MDQFFTQRIKLREIYLVDQRNVNKEMSIKFCLRSFRCTWPVYCHYDCKTQPLHPDLIIMDVHLPGMNGDEAGFARLRLFCPRSGEFTREGTEPRSRVMSWYSASRRKMVVSFCTRTVPVASVWLYVRGRLGSFSLTLGDPRGSYTEYRCPTNFPGTDYASSVAQR